MDAKRIKVLHIAYGDTIVVLVPYHFILNLFPPFEAFFNQHLRGKGKRLLCQRQQFFFIVTKTRAESAQGIRSPQDDRIPQVTGGVCRFFHRADCHALNGFDVYFIQFPDKKLPVLCLHDGLYGCSQHLHPVFFKDTVTIKFHPAIQGSLTSESQQYATGLFFSDDLFYKKRGDG